MYPFTECRNVKALSAEPAAIVNGLTMEGAFLYEMSDGIVEEGRIDLPQGRWHVAPNRQIDIINIDAEPGEQGNPIDLDTEEGDEGNPIVL